MINVRWIVHSCVYTLVERTPHAVERENGGWHHFIFVLHSKSDLHKSIHTWELDLLLSDEFLMDAQTAGIIIYFLLAES